MLASSLLLSLSFFIKEKEKVERMDGLSFVAPPYQFANNPMEAINTIGADWIAVIPIAYTRKGKSEVLYNQSDWQWWGERPEGVEKTIDLAKENGLKILLKPQVYVPGSWPGGLDYATDKEWEAWEQSYREYILPMVDIAEKKGVELFCIGTEFKLSSTKRDFFWRELIQEIRKVYSGELTYAANWDEYKNISFWEDLDYIGIDAYFPLLDDKTPTINALEKAWTTPIKEIELVQNKYEKPVLFTEYGYMSVDGCAGKTWEIEPTIEARNINEEAQANAIDALYSVFSKKEYWAGGFIWKWFPNMEGHEGYPDKDYTPQGKKGEEVLKKWYVK